MIKSLKDIKFKPVSPADLVLGLDRLTRFKYPEFKYYRVFNDILSKYLVLPRLSKQQLLSLDTDIYKCLIETVWNGSVKNYTGSEPESFFVNEVLKEEEFASYNLSDELKLLIDNKLNYDGVLNLIQTEQSLPLNLRRLICLKNFKLDKITLRKNFRLKFPVEKVVLCEGITEEILLPCFAAHYGVDFNACGIHLIGAGGKNQVAKLYCELKNELKLPIFILLDLDAVETSRIISGMIRKIDKLHLIHHGEFEDLFSLFLVKRTINNTYKNIIQCCVSDFKSEQPMTRVLSDYFRVNNLGDFQKADFAKAVSNNISGKNDLTDEIIEIIDEIRTL